MFKIIGADGRPYGPVTADQIRQWIAQNRAHAQTMAQLEGSTEWKPLSAFPEFAESLSVKGLPPPLSTEPPLVAAPDSIALANEICARDYTVDIGSCLSRGWAKLTSDFWPIVGVSALVSVLLGAASFLVGPLMGGLYWFFLKHIRGQKPVLQDAFAGFTLAFVPLLLVGLVAGLLEGIGFLFCIIPGIYLLVAWSMALLLVMDKRLQFWDAMEVSRKVVNKCWWSMFGLMLLSGLLNFGGTLCCCVGAFITGPWTGLAFAYAYEDIFGNTGLPKPQTLAPVDVRSH